MKFYDRVDRAEVWALWMPGAFMFLGALTGPAWLVEVGGHREVFSTYDFAARFVEVTEAA